MAAAAGVEAGGGIRASEAARGGGGFGFFWVAGAVHVDGWWAPCAAR